MIQFLLSSPYYLAGILETDTVTISPSFHMDTIGKMTANSPYNQFYYVFEKRSNDSNSDDSEANHDSLIANPEIICALLAVQFGKVFYSLGAIKFDNTFCIPEYRTIIHRQFYLMPYNSNARAEFSIQPNLASVLELKSLIQKAEHVQINKLDIFSAAAIYYLHALRNYHTEQQTAYLELVASGEVISNFIDIDEQQLMDIETNEIFKRIECEMKDGEKIARFLKSKLSYIKRRYTQALLYFLDDGFYQNSYSKYEQYKFTRKNIEQYLKKSYDLRSKYIHSGQGFGTFQSMDPSYMPDYGNAFPQNADSDLRNLLTNSPTFTGLERTMRYALMMILKTITNGTY